MTVDRRDWRAQHAQVKTERHGRSEVRLHQATRAVPPMQLLVRDEHWNVFLTYLQAEVETTKQAIDMAKTQLLGRTLWDHVEMLRAKGMILVFEERLQTLEMVMTLPAKIIESGKKADELLAEKQSSDSQDAKAL